MHASKPKVLVILSGCGVYDGSEIHEAVSLLLHLDRHGTEVVCAAPDIDQMHVIDHVTGDPVELEREGRRSVLVESARIARGNVVDLGAVKGSEFDAITLPGGFGAAKNLCTFAADGARCQVNADVARVLTEAHDAGRPLGFACISPVIAARLFPGVTVTIGTDEATAKAIGAMGATHAPTEPDGICIDPTHRIVSTPAYMSARSVGVVHTGIGRMVDAVVGMVAQPSAMGAGREPSSL